ncbi:MAG TPA: glycosyltransferase family 2 protein [Polyangiaceae bacterium]|nr:glycosyltransferase family 2 protein [Polyangiaceae bacterium]
MNSLAASPAAATRSAAITNARVLVVIVNYRSGPLVSECLDSLAPELAGFPNARVVVVDNRSPDDSAAHIESFIQSRGYPWATLHRSPLNGGFSYGNNQAVRPALLGPEPPDYFWLLNPDTLAKPGALRELLAFAVAHPQAGILGSSFEDGDGAPWPYAFRFPTLLSELDRGLRWGMISKLLHRHTLARRMGDEPARMDWLAGASLLVRREVFQRVGLMDEGYFLYFEETDLCLQAARAGFECWYVPASRVMHIGGQTTGITDRVASPKRMPAYWFESRTRYFIKNHGRLYGTATDVVCALSFALWRLRRPLQGKPDTDPPHYLIDFIRHSAAFRSTAPVNSLTQD